MKKKAKKKTNKKAYHLVFYVENCTPYVRRYGDKEKLKKFVAKFMKKHPSAEAIYGTSGYWVDYAVFDIKGDIVYFTDECDVIDA